MAFAVVIAATFLLVFARSAGRPYLASLMTLWGAVASAPSWGVRPQMFSLLLASIFLVLLETSEHRPKLLWWTAPLMLLWANLHAGYPIGLAFIALFLLGEALEAAIGQEPWQKSAPRLKQLALAFGLCLALVALNPNGVQIYWYPFETLRSAAMHRFIHEWFSPDFHDPTYLPLLLMLLALVAGLALLAPVSAPAQSFACAGHDPGRAAVHPAYSDPGTGHRPGSCGTGPCLAPAIGHEPAIQDAADGIGIPHSGD